MSERRTAPGSRPSAGPVPGPDFWMSGSSFCGIDTSVVFLCQGLFPDHGSRYRRPRYGTPGRTAPGMAKAGRAITARARLGVRSDGDGFRLSRGWVAIGCRASDARLGMHQAPGRTLRSSAGPGGQRREHSTTAPTCRVSIDAGARRGRAVSPVQPPATVRPSTSSEPQRTVPRGSTSLPTAAMARNMSLRLPATVTSSTGWTSSPFSTQNPAAPRE